MEKVSLAIKPPKEFVPLVGGREEALPTEIEKLLAVEFVRRGTWTYTRAAELVDLSQAEFIAYLAEHQVSIFQSSPDELPEEAGS